MSEKSMRMDTNEAYSDISKLSDADLDHYIEKLRIKRRSDNSSVNFTVNEITALLHVAAAEKNSRASAKLAKVAIRIACVGLVIAIMGIWQ